MTLSTVPRYDPEGVSKTGAQAVVVGGSMAGILASRVLTDAFEDVIIIERDPLSEEPVPRSGVPQGRHKHALLEAARATLEDLFPGYGEKLLSSGGLLIDMSSDIRVYESGGFLAHGRERSPMYCATRPLFEQVARQCLTTFDGVRTRSNCHFVDYISDNTDADIDGVVIRTEDEGETELAADLVVDASGRTSRTPAWLEENDYPVPAVDEVVIDVGYSSTMIERPAANRQMYIALPSAPRTRGGFAFPVEDGHWVVSLIGMLGDTPPTEEEGFLEFARSLPVPDFERILTENQWVSDDIDQYPFPSNIRRRYEDLEGFPGNLIVVGDAIASFNPIYGQGMSVAALEALQLHHSLAADGRVNLPGRYFDRVANVVDIAWSMAVGADFAFQQTKGPKPRGATFFNWYMNRLTRKAQSDGRLADAFHRVLRMEEPPTSLMRPGILLRVLKPTV